MSTESKASKIEKLIDKETRYMANFLSKEPVAIKNDLVGHLTTVYAGMHESYIDERSAYFDKVNQ